MRFDDRELIAIFVGGAAIAALVASSPVIAGEKHASAAPKHIHAVVQKDALGLSLR